MVQNKLPLHPDEIALPGSESVQARDKVERLLDRAGIALNGNQPWDMRVLDPRAYPRILSQGSLGLGEAYMDGWWECEQLDEFIHRALRVNLEAKIRVSWYEAWQLTRGLLANLQSKARAYMVGEHHYDLGNQLYQCMLDTRMTYTCGYWRNAADLDQAQANKLDLVCRKIGLQPGDRVLDIGCGWGSFAEYAARTYAAEVVGITISREQAELARVRCSGLPVEIRLQDYRDLYETFDHIVSLGMFEHVGWKNYRTYMQVVHRCLRDKGLFLLHSIGANQSGLHSDAWIDRHIFPNGGLPSIAQIGKAIEPDWVMEDWHNFGADYDLTLMAWYANFERHWAELAPHYDERFYRMWRYYLLTCAGAFRARNIQLWQIVLSKGGVADGYRSLR
ncbi:cyclopropane fatty acyl phospholipid synthase [Pseudomonas sp. MMS21-TM103]|uniref:cyclopropane fatty acyl phospholipid synthase n=1 Tax=Pseudomonas sp. MMS21 TM103 TaxID=2886506 RepID=UPI001EDF22C4|nr:cyclopropane fatty acyl phospholipid synthase [Pseudomonas sp. MMS21 TM103]MCG4455928.1 cyclopropane fatty acyl phospholipid synthase [Pseudomonas sp. MMS21 TM103]